MANDSSSTILIVDDEPANLAVLTDILQPYYLVRAANSGERALRVAESHPNPDLILLDVMMSGMDGYQVLSKLRQSSVTADIPVIFVTALSDEMDEEHGLELGAVDYISKPVKSSIVLARVRTQLELKAARDRLKHQNAWLEKEVARRLSEIQLIQDVSLNALAELAETRDNETGNHIVRSQAFVGILAQQLMREGPYRNQIDGSEANLITKAAPLHDIGKVGIPDRILLKPGPLSDAEFEIMKTHTRIGGEAIRHALNKARDIHKGDRNPTGASALAFLETASMIATSHHEHWDGKGYPDGLAGTDIPLAARIMSVADVYDALTNARVYKPAVDSSQAIQYILDHSGSQFDPVVTEVFSRVCGEFVEITRRYRETATPRYGGGLTGTRA